MSVICVLFLFYLFIIIIILIFNYYGKVCVNLVGGRISTCWSQVVGLWYGTYILC